MCQHKIPIQIGGSLALSDGHRNPTRTVYVPCGKCDECLEHKQKQFVVQAYRAAVWYGSLHLVTLSYDDDHLPISGCICQFEDDQCISHSSPFFLEDELRYYYFDKAPLGQYTDSRGRVHDYRKPFYAPCVKEFGEDVRIWMCPSIRKKDVQDWIKKYRITYRRRFGSMPEWKYTIIPELGGKTGRSHYHLLIYGLSTRLVRDMCAYWRKGFTQVKPVKLINEDGSDGFAKVSAYVSKYVSKGDFEHQYIREGKTFKPRITSSRYLGLENIEEIKEMRSFSLAYDVFGNKYSVSSPFVVPRDVVDTATGEMVRVNTYIREKVLPTLQAIRRRMYVNVGKFHYPLPFSFKNVIYKVYDPLKKRYTSSSLSLAIMDYMENVVVDSISREFEQIEMDTGRKIDPETYCQVQNRNRIGTEVTDCRATGRLLRNYQRSKIR